MGITAFSISLIKKCRDHSDIKSVCELGAQNIYNQPKLPAPYASGFYKALGIDYCCIDINGENGALQIDLSKPLTEPLKTVDMVTDFGTSEHVGTDGKFDINAIYNCWKIKDGMLNVGGIMLNENPKTKNWPLHGFNYYSQLFYHRLSETGVYDILDIGEHPAMGNFTDGWNVYAILIKKKDGFISLDVFKTLGILQS